jgi:MYND finger
LSSRCKAVRCSMSDASVHVVEIREGLRYRDTNTTDFFDGHGDIIGNSAIPEAHYWYRLYQEAAMARSIVPAAKPTWLEIVQCGCCAKKTRDLQKCAICKSVGYCGKKCQTTHWKMGHKRDCKALDKWKAAMKDIETQTDANFATSLSMEM